MVLDKPKNSPTTATTNNKPLLLLPIVTSI